MKAKQPTARQLTVLGLVAAGCDYGTVGLRLGITRSTVRNTLKNLYPRLGAVNAAHAVRIAMERKLLEEK